MGNVLKAGVFLANLDPKKSHLSQDLVAASEAGAPGPGGWRIPEPNAGLNGNRIQQPSFYWRLSLKSFKSLNPTSDWRIFQCRKK